jgi:myosin-5
MTSRSSKGSLPQLGSEWAKSGVPVWFEVRDDNGLEVYEFRPAIIKEIAPNRATARIIFASDNSEKDVLLLTLHHRNLEPSLVSDLTEIPILNDAELLIHFQLLYQNNEIYCYCGPSLIAINPYKKVAHTVSPETIALIKSKLAKKTLDQAPPHVWTVSAQAFQNIEGDGENQAICINGESGAGKTESAKKCLEFLTQVEAEGFSDNLGELASQILACNPILEAFGNSKTLRNDNSSRFGKYVKLYFNPKDKLKILGATMDNYLLEKSRVVSISKDERSFHIIYAACRFMPLPLQKKYFLAQDGKPCDMNRFKILRASGLYETPKVDDLEFYNEVIHAFEILDFTPEEQDAIWRILSTVLHLGNFEVNSSNYEEGKTPCSIIENSDFLAVVRLLECSPENLQQALTLRVRQVQTQVLLTPHRPENVIDFFLSMAKDLYNNLFNWIFKKLNVTLASSLSKFPKIEKLKTIGLLDIFGFEIFDKNYIEQLFINYANERLQGLYIDHIFKNECAIFKSEGLDKYVALITYKDNLGLVKTLDAGTTPPGVFPLTNQVCRLNQKDESLMSELKRAHSKPSPTGESYISFHKIKQNIFYVRHTAREVEYTIDGFVDKSRDEVSIGIIKTIEASLPAISRIYRGVVGDSDNKEDTQAPNPNAKFLSYKFCQNMDQLMAELHRSACHFIRCVKPNEIKKADTWVGYLVLKQITYMGLLDSLKVRKYNYPVRFKHIDFYKRYQDIDLNKEGSIPIWQLESAGENFRKLTENLLAGVGVKWTERDLLIGKTRVFLNEPFKYKIDEILKIKQKAKREALEIISEYYKNQTRRKKVAGYIADISRSIRLARDTLASINAKVEYVRFKRQMQLIRRFQYNFRVNQQYRQMALKYSRAKFIAKYCKLKLIRSSIIRVMKAKRAIAFVVAKLRAKIYQNRKKFCKKIVSDVIGGAWLSIKARYAESSSLNIQRHFRAHLLRKKNAQTLKVLEEKVNNQIIMKSLFLIQAHVKGLLVRSRFRKLQTAARVIQSFFRSRWLRGYYLKLKNATIRIQKNFRKFYWKNTIIASKLQEFVDSSQNLRHFALREYESLLGTLPIELKTSETVDYEFQKWTKKLTTSDSSFSKFFPSLPDIELTPKAKLFAIPFDLSLTAETLETYPGTWSGELKSFIKKIGERSERLLHVVPGDSSTFCITDDLRVYSFGANDQGQLCTEDSSKLFSGRIREVYNLSKNPALQMTLGQDTGAMVSQSGRVFFWGKYNENQLGMKSKRPINGIFVQNAIKEEFISVSVRGAPGPQGEDLNYVIGKSGRVYVFGIEADEDEVQLETVHSGHMNYSDAQRDFEYKEIQRKHHQSVATAYNESPIYKNVKASSAVNYKILEIEDDDFKESTRSVRKVSPGFDKTRRGLDSTQNIPRELDSYKKITYISSGSDFSMFLSDKGVLFGLGANQYGELGLGDESPRRQPSPLNTLRRANEKIEEVSCGFKHVVCRTNLGKIYSWGLGSSSQNGNIRGKNQSSPMEVHFSDSSLSSLTRIRNIGASAFGSYFFFDDGSLFLLGKCGPGIFIQPAKFPYTTRMFSGKMKEDFVPVKIFSNWSSMLSVGYLVFLDFRGVETAKNYKEKIAGMVAAKWKSGNMLPVFDENLHKYVQSKNMLKEKSAPMFIDVRYAGTSDGRPRSVKQINHGDDTFDSLSFNNGPEYKQSPTMADKRAKNSSPQNEASMALNRRLEELNVINKANTMKAKVGKPPIISAPLKGYKEEPLKAKILRVDDNDRVLNSQSISIPQRLYHNVVKAGSKSPEKIKDRQIFDKLVPQEVAQRQSAMLSRSNSRSQPNLNVAPKLGTLQSVVHNNRSSINPPPISKIKESASNIFKDNNELISSSNEKSKVRRQSSLIKHSNTKIKRETVFDLPTDNDQNIIINGDEDMSHVVVPKKSKPGSAFLRQSGFTLKSQTLAMPETPFMMAVETPKSNVQEKVLNPALKRGGTPDKQPALQTPKPSNSFIHFNNTNNKTSSYLPKNSKAVTKNETFDMKSKDGLFSQVSSRHEISSTQQSAQRKTEQSKVSKPVTKESDARSKQPALHESVFTEVDKIMKKDPSKWTNIEKEIINSYIKLTQNISR